jgi:phospholipid/cholesterol/gamma-HCH transport system ATP-binding protein
MIDIRHVHKSFDGIPVLKDVNLRIEGGETLVIVGCSGCGKTVLLRSIIGLIKPDSGEILVDGEDVVRMNLPDLFRVRKKFGMLFQGAALFDSMTVDENVGLALREHSELSEEEVQARVRRELEIVGLPGIEDKKPAELSGGMKKRVGLARALIMDPHYVLFDEPTTGLDPIMGDAINELILETNKRLRITSVVVTHDMKSAFKVGDRIAMLCDGRIVFEGTPSAFKKSKVKIVRQFVEGKAMLP